MTLGQVLIGLAPVCLSTQIRGWLVALLAEIDIERTG